MSEENNRISKITIDNTTYSIRDKITEDKVEELRSSVEESLRQANMSIDKLLRTTFPIVVTFTSTNTGNERGVSKEITYSWTAKLEGSEINYSEATIEIKVGNSDPVLITEGNSSGTYKSYKVTLSETTKTSLTISYDGLNKETSITTYFYYPIFYGMETNPANLISNGTKLISSTSKGVYKASTQGGSSDEKNFYLLVPSEGVTLPTRFQMGGAPFVMVQESATFNLSETSLNIPYKVYKSGEVYSNGGGVEIEVVV